MRERGFTLLELLAALAVLGILAAAAVPSTRTLIANQRLKSAASDLHTSLLKARSEAIKRNGDVTLTPVATSNWGQGWSIPDPAGGTYALDSHTPITALSISGPASVTYQASGRLRATTTPHFEISASGSDKKRCVKVDLSGRPYELATAC